MALTPEDVVNKRFNPTKFREGYDPVSYTHLTLPTILRV